MTLPVRADPRVRWVTAALVGLAIVTASLVPPPEAASGPAFGPVGADAVAHALGYALLAVALARALASGAGAVPLAAFVGACAVGAGVELLQWPLTYRTASVADAAANAVGAGLGVVLWGLWTRPGADDTP